MVDQKGIPFPVNASTQGILGLGANEVTMAFNNAVTQEIVNKQNKGLPVARYDADTKKAYLENADGTREYV